MQVITLIRQVNALCCSALTVLEVKLECVQGSAAVEVRRTRVPAVELDSLFNHQFLSQQFSNHQFSSQRFSSQQFLSNLERNNATLSCILTFKTESSASPSVQLSF